MTTLVIGGTGNVGKPLVAELLRRGVEVRVLTRSAERAAALPEGAEPFIGNLVDDPEGCVPAFSGVEAVFMLNGVSQQEAVEGLFGVELARSAGVRRFVYQSVHGIEAQAYLPHIGAKLAIQHAIVTSGMDYTLVCPNHFFQMDDFCREPLLHHGVYLQPIGPVGCWRVDARDIAEAAAIVLTTDGHSRQTYNLVGPEVLTSAGCAAIWSRALDRDITCISAVDAYRDSMKDFVPAWLLYDLSLMYRRFETTGMLGTPADVERLTQLFGRPPRSFQAYVDERVAVWTA